MKKILLIVLAVISIAAFGQTSPGLTFGQVPTPGQWNGYFSNKMDFPGTGAGTNGNVWTSNGLTFYSAPPAPAKNLAGGAANYLPYQSAFNVTSFIPLGSGVLNALGTNTGSNGSIAVQGSAINTTTLNGGSPQVLFTTIGVNFNSLGDTAIPITLPVGFTTFEVNQVTVEATSGTFGTSKIGIYTAASQGGTGLAAQQVFTITSTAANTIGNGISLTLVAGANMTWLNVSTLYVNIGTVQGAAAVGNVTISIKPLY